MSYLAELSGIKTAYRGMEFTFNAGIASDKNTLAVFRVISTPGIVGIGPYAVLAVDRGYGNVSLKASLSYNASDQEEIKFVPGNGSLKIEALGQKTIPGSDVVMENLKKDVYGNQMILRMVLFNPSPEKKGVRINFVGPSETISQEYMILPGRTVTVQQPFQTEEKAYSIILSVNSDNKTVYTAQINIPPRASQGIQYDYNSVYLLVAAGILIAAGIVLVSPYVMKGKKPFGRDFP